MQQRHLLIDVEAGEEEGGDTEDDGHICHHFWCFRERKLFFVSFLRNFS